MRVLNKIFVFMLVAALVVSFSAINVFAENTYVVAGVEALCGSNWNPTDANNKMTFDSGLGCYKKVYSNVPAAEAYMLKVVANGSEWHGDSTGNNVTFNVTSPCTVTVLFNADTKEIKVEGSNVSFANEFSYSKVAAVGNGAGAWLNGASWDPAASSNVMTEIEKGLFEITYKNVPAGENYEVKFAFDGSWSDNFGRGASFEVGSFCEAAYNGGNISFNMTEASDVKLTLDIRDFDYSSKSGAIFKVEFVKSTPSKPTETPAEKPTATPSVKPSVTPSGDAGNSGNANTGDSSEIIITTMVAVFVISAVVFAITTLRRKAH